MNDFETAVVVLHEGGAAFHPVPVVAVQDAVDVFDHGMMDVAADDPVGVVFAGQARDGAFVIVDERNRVLDLVLEVFRQGPVGQAKPPADGVEPIVQHQGGAVGVIAQDREPLGVDHHAVALVAVNDQEPLAVGGLVERVPADLNLAEGEVEVVAGELVVVARHVDHLGAFARLAQDFLHDIVVRLQPVPAFAQTPAIDDIADEIELVGLGVSQEVEQEFRFAAAGAEVEVGYEDGPV